MREKKEPNERYKRQSWPAGTELDFIQSALTYTDSGVGSRILGLDYFFERLRGWWAFCKIHKLSELDARLIAKASRSHACSQHLRKKEPAGDWVLVWRWEQARTLPQTVRLSCAAVEGVATRDAPAFLGKQPKNRSGRWVWSFEDQELGKLLQGAVRGWKTY